jgi:ribokinase
MSRRIVVAGSINMDLVVRTPRMPLPGETLTGSDFRTISGGKGANQAVAAARMGARVSLIGCVGGDAFGAELRDRLAADGIDLNHVAVIHDAATGVAVILVDAGSQNCIVIAAGANAMLTPESIDRAAAAIEQAQVLICQLETPLPAVQRAIEIARRQGKRVVLNPAPAQALDPGLLRQVDYLIPNETEAALLTGVAVTDIASAEVAAQRLRAQGADVVLLTLGAKGVLLADGAGTTLLPALSVKAVDSTAAGDTFVGGFAVGLAEGLSLAQAVMLGQRAAAISVTRFGAQTSIPHRADVDAFKETR